MWCMLVYHSCGDLNCFREILSRKQESFLFEAKAKSPGKVWTRRGVRSEPHWRRPRRISNWGSRERDWETESETGRMRSIGWAGTTGTAGGRRTHRVTLQRHIRVAQIVRLKKESKWSMSNTSISYFFEKKKFFHDFSDRLPNLRHSAQKAPTMCSRRTGIEIILKQEGRSNECPSVEMGSVVAVFECRKARKSNVVELSTRFVRSIVVGLGH